MSLARINLESFETADALPPKEGPDYLRGFKDGVASGAQSDEAALVASISDISATLSDMTFGFTEARLHLLDRLRPLLAQIADTLLFDIAREVFAAHLMDSLIKTFEATMGGPVHIAVSPASLEVVRTALTPATGQFRFEGDASLGPGQAVLRRDETHIMIDFPALIGALQIALQGLDPSERTLANG